MTRFISNRDETFFQGINTELLDKIIETQIRIYKLSVEDSNSNDIYGESINKKYMVGVEITCLISRENQTITNTEIGQSILQSATFSFNRKTAQTKNIYPEIGDIVEWNDFYYEIDHVYENQYLGGRPSYNHSIISEAHLTDKSRLNIEEIEQ